MATPCCSFLRLPSTTPKTIPLSSSSVSLTRRSLICTATKPFGFTRSSTITTTTTTTTTCFSTTPRPSSLSLSLSAASASATDAIVPDQQLDTTATSTIISALLFIAFVGLSILTIGVIYIAATDFLQKREGEKFQKEEDEKKKKGGGKKRLTMKARAGPKGFGQKIVEIEADD